MAIKSIDHNSMNAFIDSYQRFICNCFLKAPIYMEYFHDSTLK